MDNILYFDCISGISGDMTIGALLDLGIDKDYLIKELSKLNIDGYKLKVEKNKKNGITGTDFKVILEHKYTHDEHNHSEEHNHNHGHSHESEKNHDNKHSNNHSHNHDHHNDHEHRNLNDITNLIKSSTLNKNVKNLSLKMFQYVAEAEAKVHDTDISEIHFHEVGALDSIIDIVGTAILIDKLNPDKIYFSQLHVGTGFVECAHGTIPVPAPATVEILKGIPVYSSGIRSELVTPTGAAIAKTLADDFISLPQMEIDEIGYGIAKKDLEITNVLRVIKGKKKHKNLIMLETNIDDMNPEIYSYLYDKLFEAGALDVYLTNIMMKKNRPAVKINVLTTSNKIEDIEDILYEETTTLGIRKYNIERTTLKREIKKIDTEYGKIKIKIAYRDGKILKYAPEYEDCKRIAENEGVPIKEVYDIVREISPRF
ncbi:MAG: nickel pincer cofactor biosynthesis protein LarC [Candidatus Mcinerneyibacterium aminivorans]|uniref:Putative nickel insertion protein n=1 Tax=Candidatus Mcinerneyibacterium aminivorans TaxID=2703815 RepID=A0A5D0MCP4_9BACT|nr:MAG: nickel pincer cofactor biosynthesis protein LarC [Candidatus Mcinerneyibacterium aminivorans]